MSVARVTCCNCASKVIDLQQEVKVWKTKSLIEQKWRKILQLWILNTFGYDVKVEMDRERQTARIQAIENKLAMKTASTDLMQQDDSSESEVKIMLMEIKMDEDYFEFDDSSSVDNEAVSMATNPSAPGNTALPVQIGSGPNSEVVYITGNYNEESNSGEAPSSSYFILRSGDSDEIPVHIDYSHFLNGDSIIQGDNNVFYRIAPQPDTHNIVQDGSSEVEMNCAIEPQTIVYNPAMLAQAAKKRKSPPKKPSVAKTVSVATPRRKSQTVKGAIAAPTKPKRPSSPNQSQQKPSNEFGLTLREKAEVYVSTKARDAVRKVSNGFECSICTSHVYTYSSLESCMTHTKIHFEGRPYKCDCCEELFTVQRELLIHKREKHPRLKPVLSAKSKGLASMATKVKTPQRPVVLDKKWKCQVSGCTWAYATAEELGWHIKAHSHSRV